MPVLCSMVRTVASVDAFLEMMIPSKMPGKHLLILRPDLSHEL